MAISLKKGESVSLEKNTNKYENIVINLKWNQYTPPKGNFGFWIGAKNAPKKIDLDLGCLYEMQDGTKSVVQALGNLFGSLDSAPYMQLANDDRTGESQDGEFLTINGLHWEKIKRVVVFAYIYDGVSNWNQVDGVVSLKSENNQFEITMDNPTNGKNMCAIALIENINGEMKMTKLNDYYSGHVEMDRFHGFNMTWTTGSK